MGWEAVSLNDILSKDNKPSVGLDLKKKEKKRKKTVTKLRCLFWKVTSG